MKLRIIRVWLYAFVLAAALAGGVLSLHVNWLLSGTVLPSLLFLGCLTGLLTGRRWSHRTLAAFCSTLVLIVVFLATSSAVSRRMESLACATYQNVGSRGCFRVAIYDFTCVRYLDSPDQDSDVVAVFRAKNCWYRVNVYQRAGRVWAWLVD